MSQGCFGEKCSWNRPQPPSSCHLSPILHECPLSLILIPLLFFVTRLHPLEFTGKVTDEHLRVKCWQYSSVCITVSVKIWRLIPLETFSQISNCWCGREKSWFSRVKCCRLLQCENWSFNTWWIWNNWWDSVTSPQQGSTIVEIIWSLLLLLRHKNLSAKSMPSTLKISLTSHSHSFWILDRLQQSAERGFYGEKKANRSNATLLQLKLLLLCEGIFKSSVTLASLAFQDFRSF